MYDLLEREPTLVATVDEILFPVDTQFVRFSSVNHFFR